MQQTPEDIIKSCKVLIQLYLFQWLTIQLLLYMKQKSSASIHSEHHVQQVRINDQNIYVLMKAITAKEIGCWQLHYSIMVEC